ncbi:hypothetical protein ABLE91_16865 [Aquabacter sp. CN5-332]|uniref:hypothetical protein n=1 Tax=Aquabacter sp. CN5-332 TaxID=3156608 RepID=UPI0032B4C7E7
MLAAAALRLAAIEALCPTAAIDSGEGFPTLALHRVYDSRAISSAELEAGSPFTPTLSVFTEDTRIERRGAGATSAIGNASTDLVVVAELAELARDEANGNLDTDAVINGDAEMRIVLEALTAQARSVLVRQPAGDAFRRIMKAAPLVRIEPFGLPQYGVRFMRNVMTFTFEIADDKFTDAAGLPEPMASVAAALPDGSYAKQRLAQLAAAFSATAREQLEAIGITVTANDAPAMPFGSAEP